MKNDLNENPRLQRIKKVSRFFRWLCLLSLAALVGFAIAIWFLPIVGEEVKAEWKRSSVENQGSKREPEKNVAAPGVAATIKEPVKIGNQSGTTNSSYNELRTIGWRVGFGESKGGIEKIRPECFWILRPLAFLTVLFHALGVWFFYRLFTFYGRGMIFNREPVRCIRWIGVWLFAQWALKNIWELIEVFTHNPSYSDLTIDGYLLGGLLVLLVSWIMEEGSKLQEEQELTI